MARVDLKYGERRRPETVRVAVRLLALQQRSSSNVQDDGGFRVFENLGELMRSRLPDGVDVYLIYTLRYEGPPMCLRVAC